MASSIRSLYVALALVSPGLKSGVKDIWLLAKAGDKGFALLLNRKWHMALHHSTPAAEGLPDAEGASAASSPQGRSEAEPAAAGAVADAHA